MKKASLFILLGVGILVSTSCQRRWVCECKTQNAVVPIDLEKMNKVEAKDACEGYSLGLYASTGGCELK